MILKKYLKPPDLRFGIYVLYLILLVLGLYHHEMWRDEYEEYLQARDSQGLLGLGNAMSQGHAMLWQGCLWVITRFSHDPTNMQIFHGFIAACFAWVLLYKSPFKLWQSALLLLSYFILFEYAVISRCYAFGVLFFFLFAHNYSKNQTPTWSAGFILFLLANTSIYAMMLTAVILTWLFFKHLVIGNVAANGKFIKYLPVFALVGAGILIAYLQIRPQESNSFPLRSATWPFETERFDKAISTFFSAFVPVSKFNEPFFWNTNYLLQDTVTINRYLFMVVFILVTLSFIRKTSILLLWFGGIGLLLFFQYYAGFGYARYYGHFFIWWLMCMWLLFRSGEQTGFLKKMNLAVFTVIIAAQAIGGIMMYRADWTMKFSRGPEAAHWLAQNGYAENYIIGTPDFTMSSIAAELDRKIYSMHHKELGSFTKWDKKRLNLIDSADLVEALNTGPVNQPIIFITSLPVMEFEYFKARNEGRKLPKHFKFDAYTFTSMVYFETLIERSEGFWIFKVEKSVALVSSY